MTWRYAPLGRVVRTATAVVVLGSAALAGCPSDPRGPPRPPVAVVGDVQIDENRVLAVLAQRGVARIIDPAARKAVTRQIVEGLVDDELVLQAAAKAGVAVTPEAVEREVRARGEGYAPGTFQRVLTAEQLTISAFREGVRRRLTADAFLRAQFATLPAVTEDDVAARYAENVESMKRPAEVRVRQVLVRTTEEAHHLLDEIRANRLTVEQAAQKYSMGLEADRGGDLGWFARGEMPAAFDVCFALDKGQVSDVAISDYGFHIFQVIDARGPRTAELSDVRGKLVDELLRERQSAATATLLTTLRRQTPVVIAEEAVDHLVALLPPAPVTPAETVDQDGRALDSHEDGAASVAPLTRE